MILNILQILARADPGCVQNSFLGLPHWYKYLRVRETTECVPEITGINDIWLIGLALVELLLRIAVLVAIGYVIWSGIRYSESRGNVEKATKAKNTLVDAVTGLIIALSAIAIVSFIGSRFTQ